MTFLAQFLAAQRLGVDLVAELHRSNTSPAMLASQLGVPGVQAARLLRAESVELARSARVPVEALLAINTALSSLLSGAQESREEIRLEMIRLAPGHTVDQLKEMAVRRVREANRGAGQGANHGRRKLRTSRNPDAAGMRHAMLTLPDQTMRSLERTLYPRIRQLRKTDPGLSFEQAGADALIAQLGTGGGSRTPEELQLAVIMTPGDLREAREGRMEPDHLFHCNDGSSISAWSLVQARLAETGQILLYDEDAQPVDLRRTQRFANTKQRQILALDQLVCSHPDCARAGIFCEPHHLIAWKLGGETNLENLTLLCAVHNGMNDDNRERPKNGFAVRDPQTGRVGWQPPDPREPLRFNTHPLSGQSAGHQARERN